MSDEGEYPFLSPEEQSERLALDNMLVGLFNKFPGDHDVAKLIDACDGCDSAAEAMRLLRVFNGQSSSGPPPGWPVVGSSLALTALRPV